MWLVAQQCLLFLSLQALVTAGLQPQLHNVEIDHRAIPNTVVPSLTVGLTVPSTSVVHDEHPLLEEIKLLDTYLQGFPSHLEALISSLETRIQELEAVLSGAQSTTSLLAGTSGSLSSRDVSCTLPVVTSALPITLQTTETAKATLTTLIRSSHDRHSSHHLDSSHSLKSSHTITLSRTASTSQATQSTHTSHAIPSISSSTSLQSSMTSISSQSSIISSSTTHSKVTRVSTLSTFTSTILSTSTRIVTSSAPLPTSSSNRFNPAARDNLVVYYGQTPDTTGTGLGEICQNPDVDIVILAFVYTFFSGGGYPSAEFGPACGGPTTAQAQYAPGLTDCTALASQILGCQAAGIKVLVSLGGAAGNSVIPSAQDAQQLASTVWDLFGGGTPAYDGLRPFGDSVIVDGFDIDNESNQPQYYDILGQSLRSLFTTDTSKTYYLSAAPQCPYPDASDPLTLLYQCDFVWVQFYNNYCNIGTSYFVNSFEAWSQSFAANASQTKLYIGTAASPQSAGSGYNDPSMLASNILPALNLNAPNLGGIMLWDGTNAMNNVGSDGQNYLYAAKAAISQ